MPIGDLEFDLVRRDCVMADRAFSLTGDEALALTAQAVGAAADQGLIWETEEVLLRPADRLVQLIRDFSRVGSGV